MSDVTEDIRTLLDDAVSETDRSLAQSTANVAGYAAERAAHLERAVGQPGFAEAVRAERDAVALYAGLAAVGEADAVDDHLLGIVQGALALGARALRVAAGGSPT